MRFSLLFALLGVACTSTTAAGPAPAVSGEGPPKLVAMLQRGPCYGACPVYKVEAFEDGTLSFTGGRFAKEPGTYSARLSPAEVADLRAIFARFNFAALKNYENTQTSDLPWVTVSNGSKTVRHYLGDERAPASLTELESELDRLLHTAQWLAPADR